MKRIEVNLLPFKNYQLLDLVTRRRILAFDVPEHPQTLLALEFDDNCAICGRPMLVRTLEGLVYDQCCSEACSRAKRAGLTKQDLQEMPDL